MSRRRSVFRDRKKLLPRHIPESLPHRGLQMRKLHGLFDDFFDAPRESYQRVVQLYGPIGSGKTCTAYRFGLSFQHEAQDRGIPLIYVHVNCKTEAHSRFVLYKTLLERVAPEVATRGVSAGEMLTRLIRYLREEGRYLLLALDDVDNLIRREKEEKQEGGVVYDLTRLNEFYLGEYQQVVGVIFIARDPGYRELLDPSERSTLGHVVVRLPSYDAGQLKDILSERVEEAFHPGAVDDEIIAYVADLAAGKKYDPGDCRFALDILLDAGLIADAEWAREVHLDHVRKAYGENFWGISSEDLMALDEHGHAMLIAAVQALRFEETPYVRMRSVWDYYQVECESRGLQPVSYSKAREIIRDLDFMGVLDYEKERGVSIARASLKDLTRVLNNIERREIYTI